jgi:predicted acyltransferase
MNTSTTSAQPAAPPAPETAAAPRRLMSVDALRGFDMFWIIGADSLVYALNRMSQTEPTRFFARQLEHAEWGGFRFYDLIFPLFVFIVGVSLVFSLGKALERGGRGEAARRIARRGLLLFVVALFYSGGVTNPWPDIRLMGVLNRIALVYVVAGVLFCFFRPRTLAALCASLLLGYWAAMSFIPIRDIQLTRTSLAALAEAGNDPATATLFRDSANPSATKNSPAWLAAERLYAATTNQIVGAFDPGRNLANHVDFRYLPGRKYDQFYDPEGLLSTIPAVGTCLLGVFAGLLLQRQSMSDRRKVAILLASGAACVALGWAWGLQFPVIKKIWTSSYVLVAAGYSALLLGLFHLLIEVCEWRKWCLPFVWMGMNSITIYLVSNMLGGFRRLATRLAGGDVKAFFDTHLAAGSGDLLISIVGLVLAFWFVQFLYRKKIFLRL